MNDGEHLDLEGEAYAELFHMASMGRCVGLRSVDSGPQKTSRSSHFSSPVLHVRPFFRLNQVRRAVFLIAETGPPDPATSVFERYAGQLLLPICQIRVEQENDAAEYCKQR